MTECLCSCRLLTGSFRQCETLGSADGSLWFRSFSPRLKRDSDGRGASRGIDMSIQSVQLEQIVVAACGLITASNDVTALHIVTNRRPDYAELKRFRELAEAHDLVLIVLGSGGVVLRPGRVARAAEMIGGSRSETERRVTDALITASPASRARTSRPERYP
jgi:hypothetical protein